MITMVRQEFGKAHYVLVTGTGASAQRIAELLEQPRQHGFQLLGFLHPPPGESPETIHAAGRDYPCYPVHHLTQFLRDHVVDVFLLAMKKACAPAC